VVRLVEEEEEEEAFASTLFGDDLESIS